MRKAAIHLPSRKPTIPLSLTITAEQGAAFAPALRKRLRAAHALAASPVTELSLALVGDRRMSQLHQQFMNISGPNPALRSAGSWRTSPASHSGRTLAHYQDGARVRNFLGHQYIQSWARDEFEEEFIKLRLQICD